MFICISGSVVATRLSTHNDDVDFMNKHRYDALPSQEHVFVATDSAGAPSDLLDACAPSTLRLKVGAQVMLTKNTKLRAGLANGSRGVVVGFETTSGALQSLSVGVLDFGKMVIWFLGKLGTRRTLFESHCHLVAVTKDSEAPL